MPKDLEQITTKDFEQCDLKQFTDWSYEVSKIKKENIYHDRMFKYLFMLRDTMPVSELIQELIQIGIESKGKAHGFGNDAR